jgi:hypothetical protein
MSTFFVWGSRGEADGREIWKYRGLRRVRYLSKVIYRYVAITKANRRRVDYDTGTARLFDLGRVKG